MLTDKDFQSFIDYWSRLAKAEGDIPARSAVKLKDIPQVAPFYYVLDWYSLLDIRVRFLGTAIDDFLPTLRVGGDFMEVYDEVQRPFYAKSLTQVVEQPVGLDMLRRITLENGQHVLIRGVAFPARDEAGEVNCLIGLVDTPRPDTPLGFSSEFKRAGSEVLSLEYLDIGFGSPSKKPAFPVEA